MNTKRNPKFQRLLACLLGGFVSFQVLAQDGGNAGSTKITGSDLLARYASDTTYTGDRFKTRVEIPGFKEVYGDNNELYCAPKGSKLRVTQDYGTALSVRFTTIGKEDSSSRCRDSVINEYTQYTIKKTDFDVYGTRHTGFTFGGLLVPFKYYMGENRKLSTSFTAAPYVGWKCQLGSLSFIPFAAAGLGAVEVENKISGDSDNKAALSTAVGVILTHKKSTKFNAGVVFGRDFFSGREKGDDPAVDNLWLSIYLGYAFE